MLKDKTRLINELEMFYTLCEEELQQMSGGLMSIKVIEALTEGDVSAQVTPGTYLFCSQLHGNPDLPQPLEPIEF